MSVGPTAYDISVRARSEPDMGVAGVVGVVMRLGEFVDNDMADFQARGSGDGRKETLAIAKAVALCVDRAMDLMEIPRKEARTAIANIDIAIHPASDPLG